MLQDGSHAEGGVGRHDDAGGGAHAGEFLDSHRVHLVGAALSAVLYGNRNAHHAEFAELLHGLDRKFLFFVNFRSQRLDFVHCKFANHLQEQLFFF